MSVYPEITVKVPLMKISPYYSNETNVSSVHNNNVQASPALAFASGPGYESKPLVLDLRNLPSVDSPELDSSLRDMLMENMKSNNVFTEDNDDTVSEISACSSVVTLETVDESELTNTPTVIRKTARASSFNAGTTSRNSERTPSETDEEDGRKAAIKKSKKIISDFLSFNAPSFSGNGVHENDDEPKPPPPSERRRKLSITRRISPLSLHGIFTGNTSTGTSKQEATSEKENTGKRTRKLSLQTMFKPSAQSSNEKERKRRNTDPQLPPNQQVSTTIENEEKKGKEETASLSGKESQTKPVLGQAFFKEEDIKIHDLIQHVLRAHMLSMKEYKRETCDRVCKSICKILKTLVASMKETENLQCKVVCQAYIGSVREEGMFATVQTLWESDRDNFAAVSFRNDSLFGFASVITNVLC
ncbi:hypothetical protein ACROYT_G032269 [Oculina patagonica]